MILHIILNNLIDFNSIYIYVFTYILISRNMKVFHFSFPFSSTSFIVLYFLPNTIVLSFSIDVVLTIFMRKISRFLWSFHRGNHIYFDRYFNNGLINTQVWCVCLAWFHDDVIKWKHFPRYWPFVRGIHRSPVNFPHKGQWRGALKFSLICARINGWVNYRETGDLRRHQAHCDVIIMNKI